jgi:uncharacterized damage-inducible protein DinB
MMQATIEHTKEVMTAAELLKHWQGHRQLTRRVIEAFPEAELFSFSIGGMRPFASMVQELLGIAVPSLHQMVSGEMSELKEDFEHDNQKSRLLEAWDEATSKINELYGQLPPESFHDTINLFGQYEGTILSSILYFIDNEIHHRAQGYVYLRALGVEPPPFWDRP